MRPEYRTPAKHSSIIARVTIHPSLAKSAGRVRVPSPNMSPRRIKVIIGQLTRPVDACLTALPASSSPCPASVSLAS
jgi:hypothetical protein